MPAAKAAAQQASGQAVGGSSGGSGKPSKAKGGKGDGKGVEAVGRAVIKNFRDEVTREIRPFRGVVTKYDSSLHWWVGRWGDGRAL